MNLYCLNTDTAPRNQGSRATAPKISFRRAGIVAFNNLTVALMELKPGDKVTLAQDQDNLNWYAFKDPKGFELRFKKGDNSLSFHHRDVVARFLEANGLDAQLTHNLMLAEKPAIIEKVKYWEIQIPEPEE